MSDNSIIKMMTGAGALILNTHIVLTSGRHSDNYFNKDALYLHTKIISGLCDLMSKPYDADKIDVVAGPTIGGVILSQWVAHHLNSRRKSGEIISVYAEEEVAGDEKKRIFKRGYDACIPGKNVLVVEDVLTTGGSARRVIESVKALDGNVVGLTVLCNRGGIKPEEVCDVSIHAILDVKLDSWTEEECPLCKTNVPINTTVGKGRAFLQKKGIAV